MPTLLRTGGLRVHTLAEICSVLQDEDVANVEWLEYGAVADGQCP